MTTKNYWILEFDLKFDFRSCMVCIHQNTKIGVCGLTDFNKCPLANAKKAILLSKEDKSILDLCAVKLFAIEEN